MMKMKKKYISPEIISFQLEGLDLVCTSQIGVEGGSGENGIKEGDANSYRNNLWN